MKVSVVIPALIKTDKQLALSIQCLEATKKTKIPYETVIVETETNYLQEYADFHLFERAKTTATKSINRGFGLCSGNYVCLLTNDVIVEEGWLEALIDCFNKEDCGLSTLATTQLGHKKENRIDEGIWFSLALMPKKYAQFSEEYINSWDDTDLIMRVYLDGKKMYRNYNVVVEHLPGQTQYQDPGHLENFAKNRQIFTEKYKDHKNTRIYEILTKGYII